MDRKKKYRGEFPVSRSRLFLILCSCGSNSPEKLLFVRLCTRQKGTEATMAESRVLAWASV